MFLNRLVKKTDRSLYLYDSWPECLARVVLKTMSKMFYNIIKRPSVTKVLMTPNLKKNRRCLCACIDTWFISCDLYSSLLLHIIL